MRSLALVIALLASSVACADELCFVASPFPIEARDGPFGPVIGGLPPGMPVVVTTRGEDAEGRVWAFAVSLETVAGWVVDDQLSCSR